MSQKELATGSRRDAVEGAADKSAERGGVVRRADRAGGVGLVDGAEVLADEAAGGAAAGVVGGDGSGRVGADDAALAEVAADEAADGDGARARALTAPAAKESLTVPETSSSSPFCPTRPPIASWSRRGRCR